MAKNNSSKTILIIVAVILGILIIGGLIFGFGCYYLYKIGTSTTSPAPTTYNTQSWKYYNNARYKYTLNYPNTFSDQESVNGDGVSLTMSSPAISVNAYGALNSQNQSLDEYLNAARSDLFKGAQSAEEIAADETTLGDLPAQERRWQYVSPINGSKTIMDQFTVLKGDTFYTVQMVTAYSDYSEYTPMFDEILKSFKFV